MFKVFTICVYIFTYCNPINSDLVCTAKGKNVTVPNVFNLMETYASTIKADPYALGLGPRYKECKEQCKAMRFLKYFWCFTKCFIGGPDKPKDGKGGGGGGKGGDKGGRTKKPFLSQNSPNKRAAIEKRFYRSIDADIEIINSNIVNCLPLTDSELMCHVDGKNLTFPNLPALLTKHFSSAGISLQLRSDSDSIRNYTECLLERGKLLQVTVNMSYACRVMSITNLQCYTELDYADSEES